MRELWTYELEATNGLAVTGHELALATDNAVIALAPDRRERWRYSTDRLPGDLVACGPGVVFTLYRRNAPKIVLAVDAAGAEAWRYEREWVLLGDHASCDRNELLLTGQDFGARTNRWVVLDATTGQVRSDIEAPCGSPARFAGDWCVAQIDDGEGGIMRTDRRGHDPTVLTTIHHVALACSDELVVLDTCGYESPSSLIAIELSTGAERWRVRGGRNMGIAIDETRVGYVEQDGAVQRPVVRDLASGNELWRGAALPPLGDDDWCHCKLGPNALVCYVAFQDVHFFSLAAEEPLLKREYRRDRTASSRFVDSTFYAVSYHGITAWELP